MLQIATVKSVSGKLAEIEVLRKAMCDGCHNTECGGGCPMSGLFSSGKTMTATAVNKIGALPGNKVEIETSDRDVLITAVIVFLLPVIAGGIFYALASFLHLSTLMSALSAVVGFLLPFPFLRLAENKKTSHEPKIYIKRILKDEDFAKDFDV